MTSFSIKDKKSIIELINKSIGAAFLISLGNYVLLKLGNPLGPFLFALGLLGVCYMGQNLFTGKAGFVIEDHINIQTISIILIVNLISGYLFGLIYGYADPDLITVANSKILSWEFSLAFFIKAFLCGTIMYIAVKMYKQGTPLGIIYGIPLFIFCGFQHCIANIITLGVAASFDLSIILAIIGNFVGSLFIWYISKDVEIKKNKKKS